MSFAAIAAAAITAGAAIYASSQTPGSPDYEATAPVNYIYYDDEGNVSGSQMWDASKNAYVYKPAELTEEEKADRVKLKELRRNVVNNLSETPEDRIKAYEEYEAAYSTAMHKNVDTEYKKLVTSTEENMNARGLTGSRAAVDLAAENAKSKLETDTDIANQAVFAKENLAQTDKNYWLNLLNSIDSGARADAALSLQQQGQAAQIANQGTASILGVNSATNNNNLLGWQTRIANNQNNTNNMTNTASGLAYLYGYNKNKSPISAPSGGGSNPSAYQNFASKNSFLGG